MSATLRCRTVATSGLQQLNYVRGLPPMLLGDRFGPADESQVTTPLETLLVALGSCLSSHIHANALAASIAVYSLEVAVEADPPISPLWQQSAQMEQPIGFASIRVEVRMTADASAEVLRAIVARATLWSPVANTLHDPVHLDVVLGGLT